MLLEVKTEFKEAFTYFDGYKTTAAQDMYVTHVTITHESKSKKISVAHKEEIIPNEILIDTINFALTAFFK